MIARRIAVAVVAALALTGLGPMAPGTAVGAAPSPPEHVQVFPALNGIGVSWNGWFGAGTVVRIHRETDGVRSLVAELPDTQSGYSYTAYIDESAPAGATSDYELTAVDADGVSSSGVTVTLARPLTDPVPGDITAAVVDVDIPFVEGGRQELGSPSSRVYDASDGDAVQLGTNGIWTIGGSSGSGHSIQLTARLPVGSYVLGSGRWQTAHTTFGGRSCGYVDGGQLWIDEAAYGPDHEPQVLTGRFILQTCGETVSGQLRYNSAQPYQALAVEPDAVDAGDTAVGERSGTHQASLTNVGTAPLSISGAEILETGSTEWAVGAGSCDFPVDLAPGDSCAVGVTITPSRGDERHGTMRISDSLPSGSRDVRLRANGVGLPGAPQDLHVHATASGVSVVVPTSTDGGGSALIEAEVWRSRGGVEERLGVAPVGMYGGYPVWHDVDGITPGVPVSYRANFRNATGTGPLSQWVVATPPGDDIVVGADGTNEPAGLYAMTIGGGEPVTLLDVDDVRRVTGERLLGSMGISPDGAVAAVVTTNDADRQSLWTWPLTSSPGGAAPAPPRLLTSAPRVSEPAWSPDGATLAYAAWDGASQAVWTVPAGGGLPTLRGTRVTDPAWLADGRTLVAATWNSWLGPLVRIDPSGSVTTIPGTAGGASPTVSPDGTKIAYTTHSGDGHRRLAVVSVTGGADPKVASLPGSVSWVLWSPDGSGVLAEGHPYRLNALPPTLVSIAADGSVTDSQVVDVRALSGRVPVTKAWRARGVSAVTLPAVTGPTASVGFTVGPGATAVQCSVDGGAGPHARRRGGPPGWSPVTTACAFVRRCPEDASAS